MAVSTRVCCSMTSETQVLYGVTRVRQGRRRACVAYHRRSRAARRVGDIVNRDRVEAGLVARIGKRCDLNQDVGFRDQDESRLDIVRATAAEHDGVGRVVQARGNLARRKKNILAGLVQEQESKSRILTRCIGGPWMGRCQAGTTREEARVQDAADLQCRPGSAKRRIPVQSV